MKFCGVIFISVVIFSFSVPCQGLFSGLSLQEYVETLIDNAKLQLEGLVSLNDSAVANAWQVFKTLYGRAYSSTGLLRERENLFVLDFNVFF